MPVFAYLDPGSGITFLKEPLFLLPYVGGFLAFFFILFRYFFRFLRKILFIFVILVLIIGGFFVLKNRGIEPNKVLILGIDAMDPNIVEHLFRQNKLPNLKRLSEKGYYSKLSTVLPAESAVVWTSFATGTYPSQHGIFDFIMRDPKTYKPYLGLSDVTADIKYFNIGSLKIPIKRSLMVKNFVKKDFFWKKLSEDNISTSVYFCPNTFPSEKINGKMISGMGVPDLYGVMGRYTFYAENQSDLNGKSRAKAVLVDRKDSCLIDTFIYGPKMESKSGVEEARSDLRIIIDQENKSININLSGDEFEVKEGQWSDFKRVVFNVNRIKKLNGIVKFYLKSVKPFSLYCSPINIDPCNPCFPISYPKNYSKSVSDKIGLYYTQGMPFDNWAYIEGALDSEAFISHVNCIFNEKKKIFNLAKQDFKSGLFFFYFEALDIIQHFFWREMEESDPKYKDVIYDYYSKIDSFIGDVVDSIGDKTLLIIVSDHGFNYYRYAVDLNRWLIDNGYLVLKEDIDESEGFFQGIDWSKSCAYALGFGGVYINKTGREKYGIVDESEVLDLILEIKAKLLDVVNLDDNDKIVSRVSSYEDKLDENLKDVAPDIFVSLYPGYSISNKTALGGFSKNMITLNETKWSGTHFIDPDFVPGVIFANKVLNLENPNITEIASYVLNYYQKDN